MPRPTEGLLAYQKYSFYLLFTLKFPGMSEDTPKFIQSLWEFISWMSVFVPLHMAFCFLKTVYDSFGTISMDALSNFGIQGVWLFCCFSTMLIFKLKSKLLNELIDMIENTFQWRSARGKTYIDMERLHRYAKYMSIFWQITPLSSVIAGLLRPLLKRPVELPNNIWYPVNKNNPFQFIVAYFFQAWAQIITVGCFAVGSSFFFSFGLMGCGQFNVLRCALKNLIFTSGVHKRFPETKHINNEQDSAEYLYAEEMRDYLTSIQGHSTDNLIVEDFDSKPSVAPKLTKPASVATETPTLSSEDVNNFREALKNCVVHHLTLIKLCGMMEDFLNLFALLRVVELTLQMCFMAFVFVRTSDVLSLLYAVLSAIDLFFLTCPADYLCEQNNSVGPSLFMGPWYLVAKHFRTDFLIIMAFSQQPIYFTAGKLFQLNADRLRQALTTAFSYYTLLSSFDEG